MFHIRCPVTLTKTFIWGWEQWGCQTLTGGTPLPLRTALGQLDMRPEPKEFVSANDNTIKVLWQLCLGYRSVSDFKAKMHENRIWLGSAPDSTGGAYSTPQIL